PPHSSGTSMPIRPSAPISATASAGNSWSRSQRAALGSSFSRAKSRAMSRIIRCSSLNRMPPSPPAFPLPGEFGPVIVEEPAGLADVQTADHFAQAGDALARGDVRPGAAHVGLHPARVEDGAGDAAILQ